MKTTKKTKSLKVKVKQKSPSAEAAKPKKDWLAKLLTGRANFILECINDDATPEQIWNATKKKFKYSERDTVDGMADRLQLMAKNLNSLP